jgi:hypothetical protein
MGLGLQGDTMLVGSVCSGPAVTDLRAYVEAFDPVGRTFGAAPVFEASLQYTRGRPGNNCGPNGALGNWNAWTSTNVFDGSSSPT